MLVAKSGDKVRVHFVGRLEDGTVFDSSRDREPREYIIGEGFYFSGFEHGVEGLKIGESTTVTIPPEKAYGPWIEELTVRVRKNDLPEDVKPVVGEKIRVWRPDGSLMPMVMTEVTDHTVTLDANHPMAGQTLIYEIELVDIL
ncbi:MAG: peptidylprolyl isomerase [Deltaproteobacteria bacterium]|nr:peptidylprolyl isomerase [Deltaproteobacteria bacterium]